MSQCPNQNTKSQQKSKTLKVHKRPIKTKGKKRKQKLPIKAKEQ